MPNLSADGHRPRAIVLPPSETELARLRRGELEPDAVAALVERTVGLSAPAAPPEGDLVPNGSGWLLGSGRLRSWQYPRFAKWFDRWGMGLSYLLPVALWMSPPLSPLGFASVALSSGIGVIFGIDIVSGVGWRRQLKRARRVVRLADVPGGTLVRVEGVIPQQDTVATLFRGIPAVLARNQMGEADETRGVDFLLDLDGGEEAKVAVRRGFLLDPPQRVREAPACGPLAVGVVDGVTALRSEMLRRSPFPPRMRARYESSVGPGDRVEICGVVHHHPTPDLGSQFSRQVPTRPVLTASEDTPLLVKGATMNARLPKRF